MNQRLQYINFGVPKGHFIGPLNAPTQKIIGWEVFVQSQSEHFIHVQKKVSKTR